MNVDDLAEQAAPHLATLIYPGDNDTPAFPLNIALFQPHTLPEGMADAEAEELGLPTNNFGILFLKALFHMLVTEFDQPLGETRAEVAYLRSAAAPNEHKRNEVKRFRFECGQPAFRVNVKDFDSDHPIIPCACDDVQKAHTHG